jgi:hypothetical protein
VPEEPRQDATPKSPLSRALSALGGIAILPAILVAMSGAPACMGFGGPAMTMVNACPAAVAALGSPVSQSWLGISCGNAETEDDDGYANWSMPVSGPNGRGTLDIHASERGGRWEFRALVLNAGGHTIDVVACAAGGTGQTVAIAHRVLGGTVSTIVGQPGVVTGAACTVTIDPAEGAQSCHVLVACGSRTLYGDGSGGYGNCTSDASGELLMRDGNPSSVDNDPMLEMHLASHQVVVTDEGNAGLWVATITLAP